MTTEMPNIALTEREILRRHAFYQTSFTGNQLQQPRRKSWSSSRPPSVQTIRKTYKKNKSVSLPNDQRSTAKSQPPTKHELKTVSNTTKREVKTVANTTKREVKTVANTTKREFKTVTDRLDCRQKIRSERVRPWLDGAQRPTPKRENSTLFYDKTLPTDLEGVDVIPKPRKYVANTKYGKIYEVKPEQTKKRSRVSPPAKWLWEDEFLLWNSSRKQYMGETTKRTKPVTDVSQSSVITNSSTTKTTSRRSLPIIIREAVNNKANQKPVHNKTVNNKTVNTRAANSSKGVRPDASIYASYHCHRLERTLRNRAALVIQRMVRGWYVRHMIKKMKRMALLDHGRTWPRFVSEYREVVARIRSWYGQKKAPLHLNLDELHTFMKEKKRYQQTFRQVAPDGKLQKSMLMEFFNRCDLWPTQYDINRSFDMVFRGSRNTAEVVFVLDCSTTVGVVGFHRLVRFVSDLVSGLDIGVDRTQVGVVPYNEDVFEAFGLDIYHSKDEILKAISKLKIRHGLSRTDRALRRMREMFKDSRPGVQKIGIVISDGHSTDRHRTKLEAMALRQMGAKILAVGVGDDGGEEEIQHIATSPQHTYRVYDLKSLAAIRRQIQERFCLVACGFCQHLLPRILEYGFLQHEALDILWTSYPPVACGLDPSKIPKCFNLESQNVPPIKASSSSHVCRPIDLSEAMDVLWTCYPLTASQLRHVRSSRWIRPIFSGKEAWSLLDDNIIRATGMRACLRLVIQSKLDRAGFIDMPSDVKEGVERVTNETEALRIVEQYIETRRKQELLHKPFYAREESGNLTQAVSIQE